GGQPSTLFAAGDHPKSHGHWRDGLIAGLPARPQPTFHERRMASLLLLHLRPAALDPAGAPLAHGDLPAALGAHVDLADLARHAPEVLLLLSPAEAALPAREEGLDSHPPVRGGLEQHVEVVLQPDPVREREVKGPQHGPLPQPERERPLLA